MACGAHTLCWEGRKLIPFLPQDGKTAEDLARSEQHEHVAGLLARLRKVRGCVYQSVSKSKGVFAPVNSEKEALDSQAAGEGSSLSWACGLHVILHICLGYLSVSFPVFGLGDRWAA